MAEIRTVTTLRRKRDEILAVIRLYERQLDQARADLAHVTAAMRIFEAEDVSKMPAYMDVHRVFAHKEKWPLYEEALETVCELIERVIPTVIGTDRRAPSRAFRLR